jgi:hypothetical protein
MDGRGTNGWISLMNLAAALILGHLIADFPLQTSWIYRLKTRSWQGVLLHSLIHVAVTALLIRPVSAILPLLLVLGVLHFITDCIKIKIPAKRQAPGFLIDQFVHITVIFGLARIWRDQLASTLAPSLLTLLIVYGTFLGTMIFLWVLACDLANEDWGKHPWVQWARCNLLQLSRYAGLAIFILLLQRWNRNLTLPRKSA